MHVWRTVTGPFQLICGPLRPHVFNARLTLVGTGGREIEGIGQSDGTVRFDVTEADLQAILNDNASLMLLTRHAVSPGMPDPRWGWRYRIRQGDQALTVTDEHNTPIPRDGSGFFNSPLTNPTSGVGLSREEITVE